MDDPVEHRRKIEQQITRAWQTYVTACLSHQPDSAKIAEQQYNRLLDLDVIPRPREPLACEGVDDAEDVRVAPQAEHRS